MPIKVCLSEEKRLPMNTYEMASFTAAVKYNDLSRKQMIKF